MRRLLEEVLEETPPAVLEHTRQLIKREDAMTAFIEANVHTRRPISFLSLGDNGVGIMAWG
jgi:DNA-binding phage protein